MGASISNTYVATTGQINDNIITRPKLANDVTQNNTVIGYDSSGNITTFPKGAVSQASNQDVSAVSTVTFSGLTGTRYQLIFTGTHSATATLNLKVNGLSTNYDGLAIQSDGVIVSASALGTTSFDIAQSANNSPAMAGNLIIQTDTTAQLITITGQAAGRPNNNIRFLFGVNTTASQATISSIVVTCSSGTMTGNFQLLQLL